MKAWENLISPIGIVFTEKKPVSAGGRIIQACSANKRGDALNWSTTGNQDWVPCVYDGSTAVAKAYFAADDQLKSCNELITSGEDPLAVASLQNFVGLYQPVALSIKAGVQGSNPVSVAALLPGYVLKMEDTLITNMRYDIGYEGKIDFSKTQEVASDLERLGSVLHLAEGEISVFDLHLDKAISSSLRTTLTFLYAGCKESHVMSDLQDVIPRVG